MGHLGPRTLVAFLIVLIGGLVLYVAGRVETSATLRGVGLLFAITGGGLTAGLLFRWLIFRGIG